MEVLVLREEGVADLAQRRVLALAQVQLLRRALARDEGDELDASRGWAAPTGITSMSLST